MEQEGSNQCTLCTAVPGENTTLRGFGGTASWEADFRYGQCRESYSGEQSEERNSLLTSESKITPTSALLGWELSEPCQKRFQVTESNLLPGIKLCQAAALSQKPAPHLLCCPRTTHNMFFFFSSKEQFDPPSSELGNGLCCGMMHLMKEISTLCIFIPQGKKQLISMEQQWDFPFLVSPLQIDATSRSVFPLRQLLRMLSHWKSVIRFSKPSFNRSCGMKSW